MDNGWLKMMFTMSIASLHTSWQTTTPLTNGCCDDCVIQVGPLNTQHCQISTHLHAWSIAMEHAKITKSVAKLSKIYEQNELHLFPGNVIYDFLSTKVLQGSVATCVNYGRIFINFLITNLLLSVKVKEFWRSVTIWQSYGKKIKWHFFPRTQCIRTRRTIVWLFENNALRSRIWAMILYRMKVLFFDWKYSL